MKRIIHSGTVVNEGRAYQGSVLLVDDHIDQIIEGPAPRGDYDDEVDATGCFVLPGVIDEHVHFRDPGLTRKADMESESRAAAWGGVTSFLDMPNTIPQTTTVEAWEAKRQLGAVKSHVNYGFFFGATNDNASLFKEVDRRHVPGIKLFMGASTGNMLVDKRASLEAVFAEAARLNLLVMTHCEDTAMINANMKAAKERWGDDPSIIHHAEIRSVEACYASSHLAVQLAEAAHARLHIAHLSTAKELSLLDVERGITGEACMAHLLFTDQDYVRLGARIKCNPSVKTAADRAALRKAVADGTIYTVATDHAPHEWKDKQGGCAHAASGMPMLQFSLISMLQLADELGIPYTKVVELMCHHPAQLFDIQGRGFLRPGYKADIAIVRPRKEGWVLTKDAIQSKCSWSPLEGHRFTWEVVQTWCNGHLVFDHGQFDEQSKGEELAFDHEEKDRL
ncbi:dihydroorotase [Prevotella sp. AGR2160]|uniref:dihydroorotase n=1 Tax=Prevotella sp. AGR2160 TaxID=1280674 RepID=UPI0003F859B2|nr:dihydroorotase [Prevotella sp. AGR2160]